METLSVDRIHDNMAILEDENRNIIEIPLQKLPAGIREGSVVRVKDCVFVLDEDEEALRRRKNHALFERLIQEDFDA
ncbi:MAG: DUF3006 domain-containing protein [Oscillospiraceae bacterium]|nr:DUF3006 domain-containing protein [Oscillospiraceae bacterium]